MSGKIEVFERRGLPIRNDLKYYPYWALRVTGENYVVVELAPG